MPAPKKPQEASEDLGVSQVQDARDQAREQGYEGDPHSPIPNAEFSLKTGPDAPSQAEMLEAIARQRYDDQRGA